MFFGFEEVRGTQSRGRPSVQLTASELRTAARTACAKGSGIPALAGAIAAHERQCFVDEDALRAHQQ